MPWNKDYTTVDFRDEIPEFEEALENDLWEVVHKQTEEYDSLLKSPLLSIVDTTSQNTKES